MLLEMKNTNDFLKAVNWAVEELMQHRGLLEEGVWMNVFSRKIQILL